MCVCLCVCGVGGQRTGRLPSSLRKLPDERRRRSGTSRTYTANRTQRLLTAELDSPVTAECCLYRGRPSLSAGGATEAGGASTLVDGGAMTAEKKNKQKRHQEVHKCQSGQRKAVHSEWVGTYGGGGHPPHQTLLQHGLIVHPAVHLCTHTIAIATPFKLTMSA